MTKKERKLLRTVNSCVDASDLADELDAHDIEYEFADTGLFVNAKDFDRAESILLDMEDSCDESLKEAKECKWIEIKSFDDMKKAGEGSKWVIARDKRYWDSMTKDGSKVFVCGDGEEKKSKLVGPDGKTRFVVDFNDVQIEEALNEAKEKEPKLETFDEQMDFLAADEQEAIDGYEKVLDLIEDEHVREQLEKILEEERAHKEFLEAVKKDPTLVYDHRESEDDDNVDDFVELGLDDLDLTVLDDDEVLELEEPAEEPIEEDVQKFFFLLNK